MAALTTTEGIVFRAMVYRETSLILDVFTQAHGLKSYIAGNVRSKKSPGKMHMYHPAQIIDLTAYDAPNDRLSRIKEANYHLVYTNINRDVVTSAVAAFLIEVCRKCIKEIGSDEDIYNYLKVQFIALDGQKFKLKFFHIRFLMGLTEYLGFKPLDNYVPGRVFDLVEGRYVDDVTAEVKALSTSDSKDWHMMLCSLDDGTHNIQLSNEDRDVLLDNVLKFFSHHVPSFGDVKSLAIIRAVLS